MLREHYRLLINTFKDVILQCYMSQSVIDIEEILGKVTPQYIEVEKCVTGSSQARQTNTKVDADSKLVSQIRRVGGLLMPIIVKPDSSGMYEIIVGQMRTGAYRILKEEDEKYNKIRAYVIDRDLTEDEKKVISFIENFGRQDMERSDYINVIEYFYTKYNQNKAECGRVLGISADSVTTYLTHARLSPKVKSCIENGEFTIDIALKALKGLGDDESSVDEDELIETAKTLKELKPVVRKKAVARMQSQQITAAQAAQQSAGRSNIMEIEITDDQLERIQSYKTSKGFGEDSEAAVEAMDAELLRET
jgi:ParB/RepB/Spo0J family partition protein